MAPLILTSCLAAPGSATDEPTLVASGSFTQPPTASPSASHAATVEPSLPTTPEPSDTPSPTATERCLEMDAAAISRAASEQDVRQADVRREGLLGADGELTGYRLALTIPSGRELVVALPPESFVAEQRGALLVCGFDTTATGSEGSRALD